MTAKHLLLLACVPCAIACTGDIERPRGERDGVFGNTGNGVSGPGAIGPNGAAPNGSGANPGGSNPAAGAPGSAPGAVAQPRATLRRLSATQYRNSVRDLLGVEADVSKLSPLAPLNGLRAIGASALAVPEKDVEAFEGLAESISAQLFSDSAARSKLLGCDGTQTACAEGFVASFGRRVFRRPLGDEERERYLALLRTATQMTGDGWLGLRVVTSALLQSPSFLYREELGTPDPSDPARRTLTAFELASRLSFFVWNTTPDPALLDAAESGMLASDDGLRAQADRLLQSTRAADAIEELFGDYLQLDALDDLVKLPEVYPQATPTLGAAMKTETLRTLRGLLFERAGDFRDTFTSPITFVNAELAELYDLPRVTGTGFSEVTLPASGQRAGLLTQASFLATHAHPGRTSPTRRGKFIRESLMCQSIPAPPPDVNTTLPEMSTARTLREKLQAHRADPACSGCHTLMDPIGLGLEGFDGIGAFRQNDNGAMIDASGELDGAAFSDARGLGSALAQNPNVASCFARTVLRYARGALEDPSETALIDALSAEFAGAGFRMPELMLRIVTQPAFRSMGALP
jgi:hypothetical protein